MIEGFGKRARDGADGIGHEIRAVVNRHDPNAGWQTVGVEIIHGFVYGTQYLVGILPAAHERDAFHTPDPIVQPEDAGPRCGADRHSTDVLQQHRHTVFRLQCDVLNVGHGLNHTHTADHHRLLAITDQRATGVAVVHLHGVRHVGDCQLVFLERQRIDLDLILLDQTAKDDDLRHPPDLRQAGRDDPVLQLAQRHVVVPVRLDDVAVELADPRRQRPQRRGDAIRQRHIPKFLEDQLPGEVVVSAFAKRQLDDRQPEDRPGPPRNHLWDVVERSLDGDRDLLLDFLAGVAGMDRDDDHPGVGDVGIRFDLELLEGIDAEAGQSQAEDEREESVMKCVRKQAGHWTSKLLRHEQHRAVDDHAIAADQAVCHDHDVVVPRTE